MAKLYKLKSNKKEIVVYLILGLCTLLLANANVVGVIYPFCYSFLFALLYLKRNAIVMSLVYFIANIIVNPSLQTVIICVSTISVYLVLMLSAKLLKKSVNFVSTLIFSLLSQLGYIYFNISSLEQVLSTIIYLVVGTIFLYVCIQCFNAIFFRGISSRFTTDESICFCIFAVALFSGLNNIYLFGINISTIVLLLFILVVSRVLDKNLTILLSSLCGLGLAVAKASVIPIAIYVVWGIISSVTNKNKRVVTVICIFFADLVFGLFLNVYAVYNIFNVIALGLASLIFLFTPNNVFSFISGFSYSYDGSLINNYIIAGRSLQIKQTINKVSLLFKQIEVAYRNLSIGELDKENASLSLQRQLSNSVCKTCSYYNKCQECQNIQEAMTDLFRFGIEKNKITLLDANNLLTSKCINLSVLINQANENLKKYFEFEKQIKTQDQSKMIIAEQLGGTGQILEEFASFWGNDLTINEHFSNIVQEHLILENVVVNECLVFENQEGVSKVLLVVKNTHVVKPEIAYVLKQVFNLDFIVDNRKVTNLSGWSIIELSPAPRYNAVVGFASQSKETGGINGDTHSFTKISNTRSMFALADGMGHGKGANEISTLILNMVESFYKSGFSSNVIISSINKLFMFTDQDNFSTLDACIIDFSNATADFVKMGASISVIKSKSQSRLIQGENLPIGIIGGVTPKVQKVCLKEQDIIILASDGVVDSFDNIDDYLNYINNEIVINVQMLAESILEEAVSRRNQHPDDMTVVAIKININI